MEGWNVQGRRTCDATAPLKTQMTVEIDTRSVALRSRLPRYQLVGCRDAVGGEPGARASS